MRLFLIGYRATGKTSVGKKVSGVLGLSFIDTDSKIESEQGMNISEIVDLKGWQHFRNLEKKALQETISMDNIVISTGGGIIEDSQNIISMKNNGIVVWLSAKPMTIEKRLIGDENTETSRPSLTGKSPIEEIKEILNKREPCYDSASDFSIKTDEINPEMVAREIITKIKG